MEKQQLRQVYVFPLPQMVFFPSSSVPLNIFEKRYLKMVEDSHRTKTPIALSYAPTLETQGIISDEKYFQATHDLIEHHRVAGIGMPLLLMQHPDDRKIILLKGHGKVKLVGPVESGPTPYQICLAQEIVENTTLDEGNLFKVNRLRKAVHQWMRLQGCSELDVKKIFEDLDRPYKIVDFFALNVIKEVELKQSLLEVNDVNQKLSRIIDYLSKSNLGY